MTKNVIFIFLWVLVLESNTFAQNIVSNGSFERYNECPASYTALKEDIGVTDWYSPTKGTPDYFNKCSKFNVSVPVNFMGHMFAKHGNAYVGILLAEQPERVALKKKPYNEREYIQTKLSIALKKDSSYFVRIFYSVASHSIYSVNSLGVCLTADNPKGKRVLKCEPIVLKDTATVETEAAEWIELSDTIKASGGEQILTIGNFLDDCSIKYQKLDDSQFRHSVQVTMNDNRFAYYWIDEVLVLPIKSE